MVILDVREAHEAQESDQEAQNRARDHLRKPESGPGPPEEAQNRARDHPWKPGIEPGTTLEAWNRAQRVTKVTKGEQKWYILAKK